MQISMTRVARSPLRYVGLAPGQSLSNAHPTPAERQRQRLEQWTYIQSRFGEAQRPMPAADLEVSVGR